MEFDPVMTSSIFFHADSGIGYVLFHKSEIEGVLNTKSWNAAVAHN